MNRHESRVLVKRQCRKENTSSHPLLGRPPEAQDCSDQPTEAALYHRKGCKTEVISSFHFKVEQLKKLNSEPHEQPAKANKTQVAALLRSKLQRRK